MSRLEEVIRELRSMRNEDNLEGMARFGIVSKEGFGIPMPDLRRMAKKVGKNHQLALELWSSGIHDARLLACLVDDPKKVTERQMDSWAGDFYSWDLCDQCCMNLFDKTPFAYQKVKEWSDREEEFVKRAAFSLAASLAVHDKKAGDERMASILPLIIKASTDERNAVKKAVNWALRQIGKRNLALNQKAILAAEEIKKINSKSARWIASDVLRELRGEAVKERLRGGL